MASTVFISYSSKDRAFTARLASDLRALGIDVWWDRWEMRVGDSLLTKIHEGIAASAWLCVVLSKNSAQSQWVDRELRAAMQRELNLKRVFVLPLLLDDSEIPLFLQDKIYADFRGPYEDAFAGLVARFAPRLDPAICRALQSLDELEVERAARDAATSNPAAYVAWLASQLLSDDGQVRRSAVIALTVLQPKDLFAYLAIAARDTEASTRRLAALGLERQNTPGSRQLLQLLTQDAVAYVRAAARDALTRIDGRGIH